MKTYVVTWLTACLFALVTAPRAGAYNAHRGHNVDSLERVVAPWTDQALEQASTEDKIRINRAYRNLMLGYCQLNGPRSEFYARKALKISRREGWDEASADAFRYIGLHFYARDEYDSALVYYRWALECVERMAAGATSPTNPEGYPESDIDDQRSALYGSIGNLYNMMDSIPQAMDWYERAGEIFERHGWNESNSILWYNIGETWVDEGDYKKAAPAYEKALGYAWAASDSMLAMNVSKGLGRLYMEMGRTWKALPYLQQAEAYYAAHPEEEASFRTDNLEYMASVLKQQRRQLFWMVAAAGLIVLLLMGGAVIIRRLRQARREQSETAAVMDETLDELRNRQAVLHAEDTPEDAPVLTDREKEILDLLSKGYTGAQIADAVHLSAETIRWYRKKLLAKFDVANTPELVSRAKEAGLI